jgi:hypothetical protein
MDPIKYCNEQIKSCHPDQHSSNVDILNKITNIGEENHLHYYTQFKILLNNFQRAYAIAYKEEELDNYLIADLTKLVQTYEG